MRHSARIHREGEKDAKLRKTGPAFFATFAPLRWKNFVFLCGVSPSESVSFSQNGSDSQ